MAVPKEKLFSYRAGAYICSVLSLASFLLIFFGNNAYSRTLGAFLVVVIFFVRDISQNDRQSRQAFVLREGGIYARFRPYQILPHRLGSSLVTTGIVTVIALPFVLPFVFKLHWPNWKLGFIEAVLFLFIFALGLLTQRAPSNSSDATGQQVGNETSHAPKLTPDQKPLPPYIKRWTYTAFIVGAIPMVTDLLGWRLNPWVELGLFFAFVLLLFLTLLLFLWEKYKATTASRQEK